MELKNHAYEKTLEAIRSEVSFGYTTIHVFRPSELSPNQIGYSVRPSGNSLAGEKDGDWLRAWLVIGREDVSGDPIFIDTSLESFPVYTAMHGQGRWYAIPIAVSLDRFGHALSIIADIAEGRENPVALEKNPLPDSEKQTALDAIRRENPNIELEFWEILLSTLDA